jgi:hypothetical protein
LGIKSKILSAKFGKELFFVNFTKMENKIGTYELDVDEVIHKLLEVCGPKNCRNANLAERDIEALCVKSREIFANQPILLELEVPLKICGKPFYFQTNIPNPTKFRYYPVPTPLRPAKIIPFWPLEKNIFFGHNKYQIPNTK